MTARDPRADDDERELYDDTEDDPEDDFDPEEYDTMMRLEQFESLEEEMQELGVTTLEEVRTRIAELHRELDAGGH